MKIPLTSSETQVEFTDPADGTTVQTVELYLLHDLLNKSVATKGREWVSQFATELSSLLQRIISGSLALLVAEQINKQWAEVKKNFVHIQTLQNSTESTPQDSTPSPPESSPTTSPGSPQLERYENDEVESNSLPT